MKNVFFLATVLLFSTPLLSQEKKIKPINSEKELLEKFFELYKEDTDKALEFIYGTNEWINIKGDQVLRVKSQLNQLKDLVGDYIGKEYITDAKLGDSFSTYIYFAKYERQPIRFTFTFYKPHNEWFVYSFKFDATFDDDFEETIKYRYLNQF